VKVKQLPSALGIAGNFGVLLSPIAVGENVTYA
jgi:hypothetical protein